MNEFNIDRILAIRPIQKTIGELNDAIDSLGQPLITDLNLLPDIYDIYLKMYAGRGCPEEANRVHNRKKFLFVVLYLYSPKTLVGERMIKGLRSRLASLFGLSTDTPVSDNCVGLMVNYEHIREFRRDTSILFNLIKEKLLK